ncbi:MAG TPA: hypothetical protein PL028_03795 [Bacteroidales bacterium]|jgi:hypothetical protein|nr:hypothetical protein [Bacteroidales bacterium]
MKTIFAFLLGTVLLLTGCRAPLNCVYVGSGTILGFDISQSPATQTPQATLAYKRIEVAVVPVSTNGVVPDVLMDFSFKSDLFSSAGGIYSRIAVGPNATTHTPAALMMARSRNGQLPTIGVETNNVKGIQLLLPLNVNSNQ